MAEGDTVHATADRLREALVGRALSATDFRVPRFATIDLSGRLVHDVSARGKHLLIRTAGAVSIHSHLGMDGSWRLLESGRRPWGPAHEIRCVLRTDRWIAVGYRLRRLEVLDSRGESAIWKHLGPDVLGSDWNPAEAIRRLTSAPERPIGEVLIDQGVMAGPGNVYRSEVCFLGGVDPRAPVRDIAEPGRLVELMKTSMEANRGGGRRATTGDPRRGHELWVYGRAGRPCRRCGTTIVSFTQGPSGRDRIVFSCPGCQPDAGLADASAKTS